MALTRYPKPSSPTYPAVRRQVPRGFMGQPEAVPRCAAPRVRQNSPFTCPPPAPQSRGHGAESSLSHVGPPHHAPQYPAHQTHARQSIATRASGAPPSQRKHNSASTNQFRMASCEGHGSLAPDIAASDVRSIRADTARDMRRRTLPSSPRTIGRDIRVLLAALREAWVATHGVRFHRRSGPTVSPERAADPRYTWDPRAGRARGAVELPDFRGGC